MALLRTDYVSLNRGGTPSTAGGVTGTYYVDQITGLEKLIGIPLLSTDLGGVAPTTPGPHAYIDNTASPDRLYIWGSSANAYVEHTGAGAPAATQAEVDAGTATGVYVSPATMRARVAPAFRASSSTTQALSNTTWTTRLNGTLDFDNQTPDYYSTATGRFTPLTPGYYLMSLLASFGGGTTSSGGTRLLKNGATANVAIAGMNVVGSSMGSGLSMSHTFMVYFNGSTDYAEMQVYYSGVDTGGNRQCGTSMFSGVLVTG